MKARLLILSVISIYLSWGSEYHAMEFLYQDIQNAKPNDDRIFEVAVVGVDSLRTRKVTFKRSQIMAPCHSDCDEELLEIRTVYKLTIQVIQAITHHDYSKSTPLIAIDDRAVSSMFWNKAWIPEKRVGQKFILVMGRKGKVRALYESRFIFNEKDKFEKTRRDALSREIKEMLENSEYESYVNRRNLIRILKREKLLD